jgi:esterase/lipase superfamily enzyme
MFTWPSEARLLAYPADRENVLFSREALAETLGLMRRTSLQRYNLVAHSMGAFLVMETLRTLALAGDRATLGRIGSVILISADIEIDVFRRQAPPVLAAGLPIYLVVSDNDRALLASAKLRGESSRVGSVRTREELGGIDVAVIDLSAIESPDALGHFKAAASPDVIALIQKLRGSGVAMFDDGQKVGLFNRGAAIIQGATGAILQPF